MLPKLYGAVNDDFTDAEEISGVSGSVQGDARVSTREAVDPIADMFYGSGSQYTVW